MPADIATQRAPSSLSARYLELALTTPLGATRRLASTSTSTASSSSSSSSSTVRRYVSTPLCSSATAMTPRRLPSNFSSIEFDSESEVSSRASSAYSTPQPAPPLTLSPEDAPSDSDSDSTSSSSISSHYPVVMSRGRAVPIGGVAMQRTTGSLGSDGNPFAAKQKRQRERGLSDPPSPSPGNVRALRPAASVMTIRTVEWSA